MAENNNNTMFIGVAQIQRDWGISRSKAYQIIKDLNAELKKKNPGALVVSGRVNRFWYEEACLQRGTGYGNGGEVCGEKKSLSSERRIRAQRHA